jgi:hypothetical protein
MKQSIILLFVSALLCMQSCKNKAATAHLSPAKMDSILLDMHAAEVYSTIVKKDSTIKSDVKNLDSLAQYYTDIFAHYHIDKDIFNSSLQWYKEHPADLDSVYSNMLPQLSKLEGIYKAKK